MVNSGVVAAILQQVCVVTLVVPCVTLARYSHTP